ncbi:MAG TPA: class I SAM-dependent methyltransferase [Burkholderiales bacterium]|jgi:SAM-dependent methyltransferase|nr:class I SAM-dependent methyltransferase [Burkholderiales bacterium]
MQPEVRALLRSAARPYLAAGLYPYFFARGKLAYDPVFVSLLRRSGIPDGARILDLGCGQGLLAAVLIAARRQYEAGAWPAGWPAPPATTQLYGIELQERAASWARIALAGGASIQTGDLRHAVLPDADAIFILDVLHYLEPEAQRRVLDQAAHALRAGGTLFMRIADIAAGLRFGFTRVADRFSAIMRAQRLPLHHHRSLADWIAMLHSFGFVVEAEPMSAGTPFANMLLTARAGSRPGRP